MKLSEKFTIFVGIVLVGTFVLGLAWSISTGLAGILEWVTFLDYSYILSLFTYIGFFKINQKIGNLVRVY